MLFEAVVVDARRADPSEAEAAFQRRLDEPAERGEKVVSRRLEDRDVEIEVGADEVAVAVLEPLHAAERLGDARETRLGVRDVAAISAATGSIA